MNQIEKRLKDAQQKTLGRIMPIPARGSRGNKLGWLLFWIILAVGGYKIAMLVSQ